MTGARHILLGLVLLGGLCLGATRPELFRGLMQEDAVAEWATFIAFLVSGALAIRLALNARASRFQRLAGVLLAVFAVFVAGEEISWGHRLVAFTPPEVFLKHNAQQELNFHNLLKAIIDTRWMVTAVAVGYGLILPLAVRHPRLSAYSAMAPSARLCPWFGAVAALEVFYPFSLTGEFAELLLGLTFIADLDLRASERLAVPFQVATIAVAVVITPILETWIYGSQPQNVAKTRSELEALGAELQQKARLTRKRRVHKRIYSAVQSRYVRFQRDGYFLDPWNQPYWFLYTRKNGRIVLYSFGPNRRRDWNTRGEIVDVGDDILIELKARPQTTSSTGRPREID